MPLNSISFKVSLVSVFECGNSLKEWSERPNYYIEENSTCVKLVDDAI